jgi:mannose-6-phosphate isomerase-like protein (cupin superfamily)
VSGYSIANLKELENSAERFGLAPNIEARFARAALEAERSGLSYQRLAPNFRGPFGHRHEQQEETYVVVSGSGRVKLEDDVRDLRRWDAVRVAPRTARGFEAGPDGLELLVFGAGESGDTEMLSDWWPAA